MASRWGKNGIGTGWVCAGLVVLVLIVYTQVAGHDFVNWDDNLYVYDNPHVRQGLSGESIAWAFTARYASNWHPLTWLSHMLDVTLFGLNPAGHHLTSVALHALNAVLLFLLLRGMSGTLWPAAFVAGLFALHPLRVESVAWVSERKDVLSGLFWMLTILAYTAYVRRPGVRRYLLVVLSLGLGLTAKPMLVTLPCVLLLLDFWPLDRIRTTPLRKILLEKLPLLGLCALSSLVTTVTQKAGGAAGSLEQLAFLDRAANASISYVGYLSKTAWPAQLACMYPHPALLPGYERSAVLLPALLATAFLVAVTAAALLLSRTRPYLAVGWLWYVGTMVPVVGLFQVGSQSMADRYTYLPLIGVAIAIGWSGADLIRQRPNLRLGVAVAAGLILAILAGLSVRQVRVWNDSRTLFEHALAVTDDNYLVQNNLGNELLRQGDLEGARRHLEESIRIQPGYSSGHNNLGNVFVRLEDLDRAAEQYRSAIRLRPGYVNAHVNLAGVLATRGRAADALAALEEAVRLDPSHAQAQRDLGWVLVEQGNLPGGRTHLEQAIKLAPGDPKAHQRLGELLERQGQLNEAAVSYRTALELNPVLEEARNNLGIVHAKQGRLAEAAAEFERVLEINPRNPGARANLERVRAMLQRTP